MGFWRFYRLYQDTPDREYFAKRRVSHAQGAKIEATLSRKKGRVSISCPDCQSEGSSCGFGRDAKDVTIVFLRWSVQHKSKATPSPGPTSA
jgi:hypothetical protein